MHLYEVRFHNRSNAYVVAPGLLEVIVVCGHDAPHITNITKLDNDQTSLYLYIQQPARPIPAVIQPPASEFGPDQEFSVDGVPVIGSDELVRSSQGLPPLQLQQPPVTGDGQNLVEEADLSMGPSFAPVNLPVAGKVEEGEDDGL